MKKLLTLFACLFFWSWASQAQTNFKPGLVVTTSGDTLKGFIDYQEWLQNPDEITFKPTLASGSAEKRTPQNSRYVEVLGREAYVQAKVSISKSPIELSRLTDGVDTSTVQNTVFLKVLYAGKQLSFFSYTDKVKPRYYLKEHHNGAIYQELLYRRYNNIGKGNTITTETLYRNTLWSLAAQHEASSKIYDKIKFASYAKTDLLPLVMAIDDPTATPNTTPAHDTIPDVRFLAGIWLNRSSMNNTSALLEGADRTASFLPKVSVGLDAFANPNTQRLLVRTELSFTMAKPRAHNVIAPSGNSSSYYFKYEYTQLAASINPQVLYNFYNSDDLKVYVAAGASATLATYTTDQFRTNYGVTSGQSKTATVLNNYEKPDTFWFTYTARTGVMLSNKIDFSLMYTAHNISRHILYSINAQSLSIGLNFLFTSESK